VVCHDAITLAITISVNDNLFVEYSRRGAMSTDVRADGHVYGGMAVLFLALMTWLEMQIVRPVERLCHQALQVATGETQQVEQPTRIDEVGVTLRAIGQLGLMFRWLINDVSSQAVNVLNAADALCKGNDSLSRQTDQAAANVQQTAATMNELAATVKSNTLTAAEASALSQGRVKRLSRAAK
jgi:aerotaxis receptor